MRQRKILLVDDDPDLLAPLAEILRAEGYEVETAGNGEEGLAALERSPEPPQLVVLDWMMPVMGGAGFLEKLRKTPLSALPVIVCTAAPERVAATNVVVIPK